MLEIRSLLNTLKSTQFVELFFVFITCGMWVTGNQAFFTENALQNIAQITLTNITAFEQGKSCPNQVM